MFMLIICITLMPKAPLKVYTVRDESCNLKTGGEFKVCKVRMQ